MKKLLFTLIGLFILITLKAQDKHFTQFYAAPLTLNPALTGAFDGRYRAGIIYRDQWRNVLENPYRTFAASIDVKFDMELGSRTDDAFAIGLLFFNDEVSGIDFSTNQIALSGAFHKGLDYDKTQFLSLGFQGGLAQRNINYERLFFDDQFNSLDAYDLATGEELPENNFSYADLSVGLNYSYRPSRKTSVFIGGAMHHIFRPEVTFYGQEEPAGSSRLYSQYSGQLSATLPLADRVSISPRFLIALQGPHLEMNTGANIRYQFDDFGSNAIHIGSWVRPVGNEDNSLGLDALVVMVGMELNAVLIGLSYDLNLTDISTARQGAFELSITYVGEFDNSEIFCPKF
jgi:type IX secretion system PorP/SprF family membrane protein